MKTCTARIRENLKDRMGMGEFLRAIISGLTNGAWEVCPAEATWATPLGPRCDEHAEQLFEAASQEDTLLGILMLEREKRGEPVDRDAMRKNSKRIQ